MLSLLTKLPSGSIRQSSLLKARTAPAPTSLPSWFSSAASGQWSTIPGGSLSASGVMETGAGSIISAWGGAVINTVGIYNGATFISGTFLVLWGGGHGDYSGNEFYCFGPLENETPAWYKPRNSTSPAPANVDQDGSGNPVARHTYQSIAYVGGSRNWLFASGGIARATDANGVSLSHVLQFNTASPNSNLPWTTKTATPAPADVSAVDTSTNRIWSHPNAADEVQYYDIGADTWTRVLFKSPGWSTGSACSAIDYTRGIWAIYYGTGINFFRLNDINANDYYAPSTTGTAPTGAGSIIYDPVADAFKVWNGNGKQVFTLAPPATNPYQGGNAWTWSSVTPGAGSTPSAAATNGTFGRFSYVDNAAGLRAYVLLNSSTESLYFYKP